MATATKPSTLLNGTTADANQVEAILAVLYAVINALDSANLTLSASYDWSGMHTFSALGVNAPGWISNLGLQAATTTDTNDSIKLTSRDGTALSSTNKVFATLADDSTPGKTESFSFTSDMTLKLSGAHWGLDAKGNVTGAILRVGLINDGGATPALAVYYVGGLSAVPSTSCTSTPTSVTSGTAVLVNRSLNSGTWPIKEIGYFLANFTDATNVWAIQTSEIWPGKSADGIWQTWNPSFTGFSANPSVMLSKWTQFGKMIRIDLNTLTGTSNSTGFTFSLPVKAKDYFSGIAPIIVDNGSFQTTPGRVSVSSTTCSITKDCATGSWTSSGTKYAAANLTYEADFS